MRKKGIYKVREEMKALTQFCYNFLYLIHLEKIKKEFRVVSSLHVCKSPTKWIVLFTSSNQIISNNYFLTAFSIFHKFGIQLILTDNQYYSSIKPKKGDLVIHALTFSISNITGLDTRSITYICAFIIKNRVSYNPLQSTKYKFGITEEFLKNYLNL